MFGAIISNLFKKKGGGGGGPRETEMVKGTRNVSKQAGGGQIHYSTEEMVPKGQSKTKGDKIKTVKKDPFATYNKVMSKAKSLISGGGASTPSGSDFRRTGTRATAANDILRRMDSTGGSA